MAQEWMVEQSHSPHGQGMRRGSREMDRVRKGERGREGRGREGLTNQLKA